MTSNTATTEISNITITKIDWSDHYDEDSSLFDPTYTYSNDKYSCVKGFYTAHIVFNYIIFLSGLVCLVSRLLPARLFAKYDLHSWSGRIYIISMLWSVACSSLMKNQGLPLAALTSFAAVIVGLTFGWIFIIIYKQNIEKAALSIAQERIIEKALTSTKVSSDSDEDGDDKNEKQSINLTAMLSDAKIEVVESKTFMQRFFSLKAAHGLLFFVSWMQIAGRIFNDGDGEFTCHTYPVYKPIDAAHIPTGTADDELKLLPIHDPDWDKLPWSDGPVQWAMMIIIGSTCLGIVCGAIFSFYFARRAAAARQKQKEQTTAITEKDDATGEDVNNVSAAGY